MIGRLWPEGAHFDPETHTYTYEGREYPSVSTVKSRWLKPFARKAIAARIAKRDGRAMNDVLAEWEVERDRAAEQGTLVHKIIERTMLEGAMDEDELDACPPDLRLRLENWFDLYASRLGGLRLVGAEVKCLAPRLGIAGTIDAMVEDGEGRLFIGDWKATKRFRVNTGYNRLLRPFNAHWQNELGEYSLQLSLYRLLLHEHGINTAGAFLCHLPPEGPTQIHQAIDFRAGLWGELVNRAA